MQKMHYIQVHLLKTLLVHRDTYRKLQRANVQRLIDSRMHSTGDPLLRLRSHCRREGRKIDTIKKDPENVRCKSQMCKSLYRDSFSETEGQLQLHMNSKELR